MIILNLWDWDNKKRSRWQNIKYNFFPFFCSIGELLKWAPELKEDENHNPLKPMKLHAGEWHNDDCYFPTVDTAVCNCNLVENKRIAKGSRPAEKEVKKEYKKTCACKDENCDCCPELVEVAPKKVEELSNCCKAKLLEAEDEEKNYFDICSKCRERVHREVFAPKQQGEKCCEKEGTTHQHKIDQHTPTEDWKWRFENERPEGAETLKELFTGGDMHNYELAKEVLFPFIEKEIQLAISQTSQSVRAEIAGKVEKEFPMTEEVDEEYVGEWAIYHERKRLHALLVEGEKDEGKVHYHVAPDKDETYECVDCSCGDCKEDKNP